MWISKDAYGLVQLWNNKPQIFKDSCNKITFGSHNEIGVEVNNIEELQNYISTDKSPKEVELRLKINVGSDLNDDNPIWNY